MDLIQLQQHVLEISKNVGVYKYSPLYYEDIDAVSFSFWKSNALVWDDTHLYVPEMFDDFLENNENQTQFKSVFLLVFNGKACERGHVCIIVLDVQKRHCFKYDPSYSCNTVCQLGKLGKLDSNIRHIMSQHGYTYSYNTVGLHRNNYGHHCINYLIKFLGTTY